MDIEKIRRDFPVLKRLVHDKPLVYLDNAATAQTPKCVMDTVEEFYGLERANIHRGIHYLSDAATTRYEEARESIRKFINAPKIEEVLFVRGTTEGINLVASSFGEAFVSEGDEIIISEMEHHSNIVPWQMLCERKGAHLKVIPVDDAGDLRMDVYESLLNERTRLVAVAHVSNTLGTVNPAKELVEKAHAVGAKILLDGAQATPHQAVDVQELGCDFYVFSGHKVYGPTGVGILWGRSELLDAMPPYHGGGSMIERVTFEKTTYNTIPHKFEAGTPHIAGGIALGTAVDYLMGIGMDVVAAHEATLTQATNELLSGFDELRQIGTTSGKAAVFSFVMEGAHPNDIGTILDREGIAIRTGHHCTQPLLVRYGVTATARASFGLYNSLDEVAALGRGLEKVMRMFA
ncbi:MAG: cysteine desulfurase [Deltaproteobacteria bacterium]|jgi:cysteine desulfurase / selenocysteine lyase|nr:cysteine desulfurase [Deltaproteobacteria bacterium]MBT6431754.1 cysteine desulfurase [Deltaproteobacteria bacterium]MBT6489124.1 cysteine desulfurase [Deltaproteobacteria bacterium]